MILPAFFFFLFGRGGGAGGRGGGNAPKKIWNHFCERPMFWDRSVGFFGILKSRHSHRLQYPLIQEDSVNHIEDPTII